MSADAMPFDAENAGLLMRVPLRLTVEIGSCRLRIAEILKLGPGSIVELDRAADAPVDLLVNGRAIARGEIVAVADRFALHLTDLLEPDAGR